MSEDVKQDAPDGAANGTPLPQNGTADAEPWRNPGEIKKALEGQRALQKQVAAIVATLDSLKVPQPAQQPVATTPESGAALALEKVAHMERRQAFLEALADAQLDAADRKIVRRLFEAEKPADPAAWLEATMPEIRRGTTAPAQPQVQLPVPAAGQPAPSRAPDGVLPTDPFQFARERSDLWNSMAPSERRAVWDKARVQSPVERGFAKPKK